MTSGFPIPVGQGRAVVGARVATADHLPDALAGAGLDGPRPVLVSVGGADGLDTEEPRLRALFLAVAEVLERRGAAAVDGGTDAGVMRLLGRARREVGGTFPLVGVAAEGTVALPDRTARPDAAPVDPGHTHLVVVPGERWGDESPWLVRVASAIAGTSPSATLLVDGGDIAAEDARLHRRAGRPLVVVAGSGRAADRFAAAATSRGDTPGARRADAGGAATLVVPVDEPAAIAAAVTSLLGP